MPEETIHLQSQLEKLQEDSSKLLKEVQEIGTLLLKTLKVFCIYPPDNIIPKEFKENLFKKLWEYLEENNELRIGVDQSKLFFKDKIILQEEKREEAVSFALYRDGIREITFLKGMEKEELISCLEIISRCLKTVLPEDDMVTLFWEKELSHIKFLVVDEFLSEDLTDLPQTVGDKDLKRFYYSEIELEDKEEKRKDIPSKIEIERFIRDLDLIPEKELKEVKKLLERDQNFDPLKELYSVLQEIFWSDKEFPDFSETVDILEKHLDSRVNQGDFFLASEVMLLLKEIGKSQAEKGQSNRWERIKEAINRAGDKKRMSDLTQILKQRADLDLFSAKKYLSLLNFNAIPHLVDMLAELETFPARQMVCMVLENIGEKNIDLLGKGIYDRRWYVVRNIVGVLGKIGSPSALPYLKKTITHEDMRVRKETLEALSGIEGTEVTKLLLKTLEDSEERLRIKAAKLLGQKQAQEAVDSISGILCKKDFRKKSRAEKEALLKAWANLGKDEAIPLLRKEVLKRAWLRREKQKETSTLALKALASIDTSFAQDNLKELCTKGSRKIRQQAKALWEKSCSKRSEQITKPDLG